MIAANAKINLSQLGLTKEALKKVSRYLPSELGRALNRTLVKVEKYAKVKAPHKTGQTAAQIASVKYSAASGAVGTNQEAAAAIDEGARPHKITPNASHGTKALAIPVRGKGGKYVSYDKDNPSRSKRYRKVKYKDVAGAPNKRHLAVEFNFVGRVHHPGTKGQPFLSSAALIANKVSVKEANKAADIALKKSSEG